MCFSCPVQTPQCLDAACTHVGTRAPGPVGVVLERLNAVGTVWDPSCTAFRDCFGIWSPWTSCFSEVKARLVCAWQVAIAAPLQHRAGFAGFASVDPASTRRAAKQYTGEARAFLRVAWNGTFYTQAELFHLGQGETNSLPLLWPTRQHQAQTAHMSVLQPGKATARDFDFQGTRAPGLSVSALLGY